MAKRNGNKRSSAQGAPAKSAGSARQAPSLEKYIPMWTASFENASKVYQSLGSSMDIDVDQEWLGKVLDTLQKADDTAPVAVHYTHLTRPTIYTVLSWFSPVF